MNRINQDSIKTIFVTDHIKIEGTLRAPREIKVSDFIARHKQFLPVYDVKYVQLENNKEIHSAPFAYINAEKSHLIIPEQSVAKQEGLPPTVSLREIMTKKIHTVTPTTSVLEAFNLMRQHHIHHLPVLDNHRLVGLISKRDLGMFVWHESDESVDRYMKTEIYAVDVKETVQVAVKHMVSKEITCLPILENKKLVGIITQRDLFKFIYKDVFAHHSQATT